MSAEITKLQPQSVIDEQACIWLLRIERGLTELEKTELKTWLEEGRTHLDCMLKHAHLWDQMESLRMLGEVFPINEQVPEKKGSLRRRWLAMPAALSAVSAVAFTAVIVSLSLFTDPVNWFVEKDNSISFETQIGEYSNLILSDLSTVTLNTDSHIDAKISEEERRLVMYRGEAHFEVAHDASRPFIVKIGDREVRAIGTAFSIRRFDENDFEVLVSDGEVLVSEVPQYVQVKENRIRLPASTDGRSIKKGQKLTVSRSLHKASVEEVEDRQINEDLLWRSGKLVFRGELLPNVLREVARYSKVELEIADEGLREIRVAGLYQAGDVDGLVHSFEQNLNIGYRWDGSNKVTLFDKAQVE